MTRGQESLLIELEYVEPIQLALSKLDNVSIRIIEATAEEYVQHLMVLENISRESNDNCLWSRSETVNPIDTKSKC